ncbi:hypothetical protein N7523_005841 [Penicillium sp. IBT 18751x]|nr:hypothetical protein N7523_005841 [Penicillium sp. IBT 18751x]
MRQDNPASASQAHLAWMAKQLGFHSSQIEEHAAKHCSAATETPHLPTWTDSSDVPLDERLGQKAERLA